MNPRDGATRQRPGIAEGTLVAAIASVTAAAGCFALTMVLPAGLALRGVISALTLAYVCYLVTRSEVRVGRLIVVALCAVAVAATAVLEPGLVLYLAAHLVLVWLVRSLYFHTGVVTVLADACLAALGLLVGGWVAARTGSVLTTTWCVFLVQALFCFIPTNLRRAPTNVPACAGGSQRFDRAHQAAEAAVRKLSTTH